jgi:hypothetical protein
MKMMRYLAVGLALTALAGPSVASAGSAPAGKTYSVSATMVPRSVVTPASKPWKVPSAVKHAEGDFSATLLIKSGKPMLVWKLTYRNFSNSLGIRIADIHLGTFRQFGAFLARLCGPCSSSSHGTKKLTSRAYNAILAHHAWITLITPKYPNGVVRGQISVR